MSGSWAEALGPVADLSYTGQVPTTDQGDRLVLTGPLARWITERATVEGRTEADVVAEALAVRWGAQLGDADRDVWEASEGIDEAAADKLVDDEVYRPRQERRRAG